MSARAKTLEASRRAAEAADGATSAAKDHCRRLKTLWRRCTGISAGSATFIISLFPFCFAAGLLAYTEANKLKTGALGVISGFGPTHTAWREAVTIMVIVTFLLSSVSIFFRQQNVLELCGMLQKYCAMALFVVASFDKDTADQYCVEELVFSFFPFSFFCCARPPAHPAAPF